MTTPKRLMLAAAIAALAAFVSVPANAFWGWFNPFNWFGGGWGGPWGWGGYPYWGGWGGYPYWGGWGGYPYLGGWGYPYGGWGYPYASVAYPYTWGVPTYTVAAVASPSVTTSSAK